MLPVVACRPSGSTTPPALLLETRSLIRIVRVTPCLPTLLKAAPGRVIIPATQERSNPRPGGISHFSPQPANLSPGATGSGPADWNGVRMRVLVLGGGVVGTSIAYHLSARGADVVVIERNAVACAASGKSGGFLAQNWCDGTPLMALARRSFALHAQLAEELGGDWGYRGMTTYGGTMGRPRAWLPRGAGPGWVSPDVAITGEFGLAGTTAQVQPGAFTGAMMRAAQERGAALRFGRATGLLRCDGDVVGVQLEGEALDGDAVVIAMGPWSVLAAQWLPLPPVYGLKGHSLVLETGAALPPEALFLEYAEPAGSMLSLEVFPRADGTTYVCGISSQSPLPIDPGLVAPDEGATDRLTALCARMSPVLARSPNSREPGVLPSRDGGWLAADRRRPGRPRRLRGNRPRGLGHPQRPRDWRGNGRADPGRDGEGGRSFASRSRSPGGP